MEDNFFFVDGSSLLADLRRARVALGIDSSARLAVCAFARYFTGARFEAYHGQAYRRFVFYLVRDARLSEQLLLPSVTTPDVISDLRFEYCGERIKRYERAAAWLDDHIAPKYVRESLYRSEKAVDTQICCDALQLLAVGHLTRLFLYTNDFDFVPLCRTLRQLGANVNLFRLRAHGVNKKLVAECDAFHVMEDAAIRRCLVIPSATPEGAHNASLPC